MIIELFIVDKFMIAFPLMSAKGNEANICVCMYIYIQGDSKLEIKTLREDRAHHEDSELLRNPCPQTSS